VRTTPSLLDAVLHVTNPTREQRILQHARRLEIALEQRNVDEAYRTFNLMMRLYKETHCVSDPK
jgi:chorismate mutase